jgi:hypothetical protein
MSGGKRGRGMSDLIERGDAIKALYKYSFVSKDIIEREINAIPSADRPRGEWIRTGRTNIYGGIEVQCSNCGARMKGATDGDK